RSGRTRQTSWPRLSNTRAKPSCSGGSSLGRSGSTRGAPSKTTALPCCSRFIVVSSSTRKPGRWAIISAGLTRSRSSSPWATAASSSSSVDASSKTLGPDAVRTRKEGDEPGRRPEKDREHPGGAGIQGAPVAHLPVLEQAADEGHHVMRAHARELEQGQGP